MKLKQYARIRCIFSNDENRCKILFDFFLEVVRIMDVAWILETALLEFLMVSN